MQKLLDHFHPECPFICSYNELINSHKGVWYAIIGGGKKNIWNRWKINAVVLGQGWKIGFHWAAGFCIDTHYFSLCLPTLVKLTWICPLWCSIELFNKKCYFQWVFILGHWKLNFWIDWQSKILAVHSGPGRDFNSWDEV